MDLVVASKFIQALLEATIALAVPVVAHAVISYLRVRAQSLWATLSSEQQYTIKAIVSMAVTAAEQSGLRDEAMKAGAAKKEYALKVAEKALAEHGLTLDLHVLDAMIEAAVWDQFNRPSGSGGLFV